MSPGAIHSPGSLQENRDFLERERERPYQGEVAIIKVGTALGARRAKNEPASAPDALLKKSVGLVKAIESIGAKVAAIIEIDCSPHPDDVIAVPKGGVWNEKGTIRMASDLAKEVEKQRKLGRRVIVLGGDHSISLGTVPGFVAAIKDTYGQNAEGAEARVDAHGDMQTRKKSPSKHPHGMTEAANYGLMDPSDPLASIHRSDAKLHPSHVVQIGTSDLDQNEIDTPLHYDIQIQTRGRMRQIGLDGVMRTLGAIREDPAVREFMVSIDIDGLHQHATPQMNNDGVRDGEMTDLSMYLSTDPADKAPVTVIEIAEYSPLRDHDKRTATFIRDQIVLLLGGRPSRVPYTRIRNTRLWKLGLKVVTAASIAAATVGAFLTGKNAPEGTAPSATATRHADPDALARSWARERVAEGERDEKKAFTGVSSNNNFYPFYPVTTKAGWSANTGKMLQAGYNSIVEVLADKGSVLRVEAERYLNEKRQHGWKGADHSLTVLQSIVYGAELKAEGDSQAKKAIWLLVKEILGGEYDDFVLSYDNFLRGVDKGEVNYWLKLEGYKA